MGSEQLPHLALDENPDKPSKKKVFFIAVFSFLLLSLPVVLFLSQRQTQLSSKASNDQPAVVEDSLSLSTPAQTVGVNQEVPVDILVRADSANVNLASVKLQFNPSVVKVADVITSQNSNKVFFGSFWLSKGYDNDKGEVSLIAGAPKPGIRTTPGQGTYLLAQVRFVTLSEGQAEISFSTDSMLYKNDDNASLNPAQRNLTLSIQKDAALPNSGDGSNFAGKIVNRFAEMQPSSENKNQLIITNPQGADVFFYFRPIEITWTAAAETIKSLTLYLNGEPYGVIAENIPNTGHFTWTPSLSVPLQMIIPSNTYALVMTSLNKGQENKSEVSSPFGLISNPNGKTVASGSALLNTNTSLAVPDSSKILSRWGEQLSSEDSLDLNKDDMINFLDWYLLRKSLFVKDLVY